MRRGWPEGNGRLTATLTERQIKRDEKKSRRGCTVPCLKLNKKNKKDRAPSFLASRDITLSILCLEGSFQRGVLNGFGTFQIGGQDLISRNGPKILYRGMVKMI